MDIECQRVNELIQINTEIDQGKISVCISLTSLSIQQGSSDQISEEHLTKRNCLKALNEMYAVRWFQVKKKRLKRFILFEIFRIKLANVNMPPH